MYAFGCAARVDERCASACFRGARKGVVHVGHRRSASAQRQATDDVDLSATTAATIAGWKHPADGQRSTSPCQRTRPVQPPQLAADGRRQRSDPSRTTSVGWVVAGRFGDFGFSDPRPSGPAGISGSPRLCLRARARLCRTSVPHARASTSVVRTTDSAKRPCQDQAHGSIGRPFVATRTRRYGLPRWSKPLRSGDGELAVQQCTVGPQQQRREGTNRGEQG